MPFAAGTMFGPYEIGAPIGAGGMGEVYRARDGRLGRDVAVKVLPRDFARDPERLARFEQEARSVGCLNHPNILAVYDVGNQDGIPYIVTELLEGETLRARLDHAGLPVRKAVEYAVQLAAGLAAAHARGVIHRDLKPDNVFITRDGRVKILDFGLARRAAAEPVTATDVTSSPTAGPVTADGLVFGTVGYMSPEQVRGHAADQRSDIFSFGVVVHEMLTGRRAFAGDSSVETLNAILKETPPDVSTLRRELPPALDGLVRRCLEKSPDDRFHSARDLGFALEAVSRASGSVPVPVPNLEPGPGPAGWIRRQRATVFAVALVGLVCLAGGAALMYALRPAPRAAVPVFRQLTFSPGYSGTARFTRDGATVIYSGAWNGAANQLFSVRTGGSQPKGLGVDAEVLGIAATGDMAVLLNRRFLGSWLASGTLARLPVEGGTPRPLLEDVYAGDISADGSSFTVVRSVNGRQRLEYPPGKVLFDTPGWISHVRFSPDGASIAFVEHPLDPDDRGFVSVIDPGGRYRRVTGVYVSLQGLAWTTDGREIWYTGSAAGEDNGLYAVARNGRIRPVLRAPIELRIEDIARGGEVLLASTRYQIEMGAQRAGSDSVTDLSWNATSDLGALSGDGSQLVFNDYGERNGSDYAVYFRAVNGGSPVYIGPGYGAGVSPDGGLIAASVFSKPHQMVLYPTGPGEPRVIELGSVENHSYNLGGVTWTRDGRRFSFTGVAPDGHTRDYIFDVASGKFSPVTPPDSSQGTVSPGGDRIISYEVASRKAVLVDVPGGTVHDLPGVAAGDRVLGWGSDEKTVFAWDRRLPADVYRVDITTGRRERVMEVRPQPNVGLMYGRILVAPDGQSACYRVRRGLSTVYAVKGLE
jgi:eukaryotic-like serine/threonine-protein kinase